MIKKILKISISTIVIIGLIILFANQSCSSQLYSAEDIKMKKINNSKNYREDIFFNSKQNHELSFTKMLPMIWDFLFLNNNRKPEQTLPMQMIDFEKIKSAQADELKVTWVGHSSQIINMDGKIILTDPVYDDKTVFMGPSRYNGSVPLNIDDLPEIDLVVISHNHYDHLNSLTIEKIHNKVKQFITPLMVGAELEKLGVPREKIIELDWWEEVAPFKNFLVVLTPSQHFSGRGLFDRDKTLWGSYVVKGPHHKIYFSGDSGYFDGFKEIGYKYGPFDYTFMECGAYNKKWHAVHMFPEETVQAHIDLKGKILHPIHWGTFDLALHAWYDPMIRVAKAADKLGVKLSTPIVGETITVDENLTTNKWWKEVMNKNLNEKNNSNFEN